MKSLNSFIIFIISSTLYTIYNYRVLRVIFANFLANQYIQKVYFQKLSISFLNFYLHPYNVVIIFYKGCDRMNYFDMYKMILEIIAEQNPKDFQELLDDSQKYPLVKEYIASDNNNQILIRNMQDTTISMINDGLISGIISPLKYVTLIKLNGLTISGFQYLKKLKTISIKMKLVVS
jgi:hypothetical protein